MYIANTEFAEMLQIEQTNLQLQKLWSQWMSAACDSVITVSPTHQELLCFRELVWRWWWDVFWRKFLLQRPRALNTFELSLLDSQCVFLVAFEKTTQKQQSQEMDTFP